MLLKKTESSCVALPKVVSSECLFSVLYGFLINFNKSTQVPASVLSLESFLLPYSVEIRCQFLSVWGARKYRIAISKFLFSFLLRNKANNSFCLFTLSDSRVIGTKQSYLLLAMLADILCVRSSRSKEWAESNI